MSLKLFEPAIAAEKKVDEALQGETRRLTCLRDQANTGGLITNGERPSQGLNHVYSLCARIKTQA